MTGRLIHYSDKYLKRAYSEGHNHCAGFKTPGLWTSVDDDWKRWCEAESFRTDRLKCATEVVLRDDANVLRLCGAKALDRFTKQYGIPPPYASSLEMAMGYRCHDWIDWPKVREKHQGLIIAPYCWSRRLELTWYYGWDCASGVIWDAEAIKALQPLTPDEPPRQIEIAE